MPRVVLILMCCVVAADVHAQRPSKESVPDLKVILQRTRAYVESYEEKLGTLIGEEDYVQTATWNGSPASRRDRIEQRRLSSDFLLVRVGETWLGVRNVLQVNRRPVDGGQAGFNGILDGTPDAIAQRFKQTYESNSRYNLGDFVRT